MAEELALEERAGRAAQLTATKDRLAAGCASWIARASSSLPVPGLPEEQDGRGRVGDLADLLHAGEEHRASPDDLAEVARFDELGVKVGVFGRQALTQAFVLRQGRPECEVGVPTGQCTGDDLADQPEASDQVRRPPLLVRDRCERDDADDTIRTTIGAIAHESTP